MNEEMNKKNKQSNKKQLIISAVVVLTLVIAVVGVSFAVWNYVFNGTLVNTISTTDISLDLLESNTNIITIENALPMSDNEGKVQTETFDFAVTSKTVKDIDIEYNINIQKLEVDNGYTALNDNQIKVYLTDYSNTQKVAPTLVSNLTNYKLYTGTHTHDATHETVQDKFKLRVWIDGSVDASSWTSETKLQYRFKIGLTSEEKEPNPYPEYVYRYGTDTVSNGTSLIATTGTKWIIKMNGEEIATTTSYVYDTHEECTAFLTSGGITEGEPMQQGGDTFTFTCAEKIGTFGGFDYTEDYTTLNKQFFLKHNLSDEGIVESSEVCYILNNNLYCLKGGDGELDSTIHDFVSPSYDANMQILLNSFGESNCSFDNNDYRCSDSNISASANPNGHIFVSGNREFCSIMNGTGLSSCGSGGGV